MFIIKSVTVKCPQCGCEIIHTLPETEQVENCIHVKCPKCDTNFVSLSTCQVNTGNYKLTQPQPAQI